MTVSIILIALIVVAVWWLLGLFSYILFHPYVDTLKEKVVLNAIAFPALFAIHLTVLRNEKPLMIPAYFVAFAVFFAISTVAFHFVEQWLYGSNIKRLI
jgi:hypothetical protein